MISSAARRGRAAVRPRSDERGRRDHRRRDRLQRIGRAESLVRRDAAARRALRVALADGSVHELRRTRLEKNTVGYAPVHDPVDWFVGSEGTLGVILEAELSLLPLPATVTGLAIPFAREADALDFVVAARTSTGVSARCLEFFDDRALAIARGAERNERWARMPARSCTSSKQLPRAARSRSMSGSRSPSSSAQPRTTCPCTTATQRLRDARRIRHAVPATMNERGARSRAARRPQGLDRLGGSLPSIEGRDLRGAALREPRQASSRR